LYAIIALLLVRITTTNAAITDKPHNTFIGQSRSPNMVPLDILDVVSY